MKTIMILADTVNRRHLSTYGNDWVKTPNLERLQQKSVVFDNHWTGSAPCMPARRDIMTGRLNFLERSWGAIEPFDYTLPYALRDHNIFTHMLTDHYHYLELGGENYCQIFDTWECFRGQERDPVVSKINKEKAPKHLGVYCDQYELNKSGLFTEEKSYTTPKTFQAAAEWLETNNDADNFFLWVEGFDPHEPFDVPEEYLKLYEDDYEGPLYYWPHYCPVDDVPEDAMKHIRKRYAATLTMMDKWLGKILDTLDKYKMWDDTMVIFTTDHGFMLGEHGYMGKNYMPAYNEIFHIPFMIHYPGVAQNTRVDALTQNIDIFPTVLEYFGIDLSACKNKIHGKSLLPLMKGEAEQVRECALYGYFGKSVNMTDGKYTYFRCAERKDNLPLYLYGAIPTSLWQYYGLEEITDLDKLEMGRYLKWTKYPVYKIPASILKVNNGSQDFTRRSPYNSENLLFDIQNDYEQNHPIRDELLENELIRKLKKAMIEHDTPEEQFIRLGIDTVEKDEFVISQNN